MSKNDEVGNPTEAIVWLCMALICLVIGAILALSDMENKWALVVITGAAMLKMLALSFDAFNEWLKAGDAWLEDENESSEKRFY